MTNVIVHPSTIEGIKRLAKSIKRERKITHSQALQEAAKTAGFQNLRHAQRALPHPAVASRHPLYISAYWRTREGTTGRETLLIHTHQHWAALLKPQELKHARGLRHFRIDAPDHFETAKDMDGQDTARKVVCAAARTLRFMDATGLRPATARTLAFERRVRELPDSDHSMIWIAPETQQFVMTDEPYNHSADFIANREYWANYNGLAIVTVSWPGMYVPGSSTLYLVSDNRDDLISLAQRLDRLRSPPIADEWSGESAPYSPVLVTPGREASGRVKRSRPRPNFSGQRRRRAVVYGNVLSGTQWRPDAKMPISSHKQAGALLRSILDAPQLSANARQRIARVRYYLDDWVQREYNHAELPNDEFNALYYGKTEALGADALAMIEQVSKLLRDSYPDSAPLRSLIRSLQSAERMIRH